MGETGKDPRTRWMKRVAGAAAMTPAAVTTFQFLTGRLGSNPIAQAMNQLGLWTLITLLVSLGCTPLKIVLGWNWPLKVRKMLGLCAFANVCLHFLVYLLLDQGLALDEIWKDIAKRKFITVGFLAFVILIPLAVTSPSKMVKRLGFRRWKRLHRLVYVAAALGVVHFIWRVKADLFEPLVYAGVLACLLLIRFVSFLRERSAGAAGGSSATIS